jgi:ATP-dependent DNA helicase RecQ
MKFAKSSKIPPYKIFNDETLKELLIKKPKTINQFERINGIGYIKAREIGDDFIKEFQA